MGTQIMRVTSYFLVIFFSGFCIIIKTWCHDHFFGWSFSMFCSFSLSLNTKVVNYISHWKWYSCVKNQFQWDVNGAYFLHNIVLLLLQFFLANYFICLLHFLSFRFMLVYLSHLCEFSNLSFFFFDILLILRSSNYTTESWFSCTVHWMQIINLTKFNGTK